MDNELLQSRASGATATNNEAGDETPDVTSEAREYRELAIEAPAPPVRVKLEPPISYDGHAYSEIVCDFDAMTGKDFQLCERQFNRHYKPDRNETPLPEMKHDYHCFIIARASQLAGGEGVPYGLILKLPRRYYTPLRIEALKACGSSPEEESR